MQYPPAAADPVDAGLPDGGMPAAGKGGGRRQALRRRDRPLCPRRQSIRWTDRPAGRHHHQRRRTGAVFQKREGRINEHLVSQYPAGSSQRHGDPGGDLPAAVGVFRVFTGLVAGGASGRAAAYERQSAPAAGDHAKRRKAPAGLHRRCGVPVWVSTVRRRWYNGYMADLEKRGEVYYDARTGTYYIVPNAAGN